MFLDPRRNWLGSSISSKSSREKTKPGQANPRGYNNFKLEKKKNEIETRVSQRNRHERMWFMWSKA